MLMLKKNSFLGFRFLTCVVFCLLSAPCFPLPGELLQHLEGCAPPPLLLSPASLNRVLEAAISASLVGSTDPMTENLTFLLRDNQLKSVGIPGGRIVYTC